MDRMAGDDAEIRDVEPFGVTGLGDIGDIAGRRINDAGHRRAIADQRDVDGEIRIVGDEFLGAVKRIDKEEFVPRDIGHDAGGDAFLGDDGDLREMRLEVTENDRFGALVGLGHRRGVGLEADGRAGAIDLDDGTPGFQRGGFENGQHGLS